MNQTALRDSTRRLSKLLRALDDARPLCGIHAATGALTPVGRTLTFRHLKQLQQILTLNQRAIYGLPKPRKRR